VAFILTVKLNCFNKVKTAAIKATFPKHNHTFINYYDRGVTYSESILKRNDLADYIELVLSTIQYEPPKEDF